MPRFTVNCAAAQVRRPALPTNLPFAFTLKQDGQDKCYLAIVDAGHIKRVRLSDGKVFDMASDGRPGTITAFYDLLVQRYGADNVGLLDANISLTKSV